MEFMKMDFGISKMELTGYENGIRFSREIKNVSC